MFARRCAAVVMIWSSLSCAGGAQARDTCAAGMPSNVEAGMLARDAAALLRRSETFRSQCDRLAQSQRVHVRLSIVFSLDSGRAQTVMRRSPSGTIDAAVVILFGENYQELLAHEFEHILEQIDGVDLRREAGEGRAWELPSGAFETRRAMATGAQVVRELAPPHAQRAASSVPATR